MIWAANIETLWWAIRPTVYKVLGTDYQYHCKVTFKVSGEKNETNFHKEKAAQILQDL
jgi:hypothetical protein